VTEESEKAEPSRTIARGMVEVFTGEGKGKTSAALGMILRALGHGLRIHIVFFMKGSFPYGEQKTLSQLPNVTFKKFGFETFCDPANIKLEEKEQAQDALLASREAMLSGDYDMVILDEVNVATGWKLIDISQVVQLIKDRPENVELILTGRHADPRIIELADVVTNMAKVKHPYDRGILSRKGLDY
jgi:cob(I)alamin adenosyltransferase